LSWAEQEIEGFQALLAMFMVREERRRSAGKRERERRGVAAGGEGREGTREFISLPLPTLFH